MASYRVDVADRARREIRRLPGNMRQRVIRSLRLLQDEARPADSQILDTEKVGTNLAAASELRRLRLDDWRIVYLVEETSQRITILAVRRRPPYQYEDLTELLKNL
jgi:mRNA-degrading endonuclease RelE of RelBE toxin-antitoxin system